MKYVLVDFCRALFDQNLEIAEPRRIGAVRQRQIRTYHSFMESTPIQSLITQPPYLCAVFCLLQVLGTAVTRHT